MSTHSPMDGLTDEERVMQPVAFDIYLRSRATASYVREPKWYNCLTCCRTVNLNAVGHYEEPCPECGVGYE